MFSVAGAEERASVPRGAVGGRWQRREVSLGPRGWGRTRGAAEERLRSAAPRGSGAGRRRRASAARGELPPGAAPPLVRAASLPLRLPPCGVVPPRRPRRAGGGWEPKSGRGCADPGRAGHCPCGTRVPAGADPAQPARPRSQVRLLPCGARRRVGSSGAGPERGWSWSGGERVPGALGR